MSPAISRGRPILLALLALVPGVAAAQAPRLDVDHVLVTVSAGARAEMDAVRAAGFTVPPRVTRHEGQGTASVSIVFANAYLELFWVDSSVAVADTASVAHFRRATNWRTSGVSPFGLGLRRVPGTPDSLGVPTTRYSAPWMQPGTAIEFLGPDSDSLAAPLFIVPAYMAVPSWIAQLRDRYPEQLRHPGGGERITAVRVHGPRAQRPSSLRALSVVPLTFVESDSVLVELEIDGGVRVARSDLRPLLPVVLVR